MSNEKRKKILHGVKPKKKAGGVGGGRKVDAQLPYPPGVRLVRLDGLKFDSNGPGENGDIVKDAKKGINVYCDSDGEFLRVGAGGIGNLPGDFFGQFPKGQARVVRKALRRAGFPRLAALPAYGRA
jgi:hypothetical protein